MSGLFGNRNAAGPHKRSAIGKGLSMLKETAVGGAQIGSAVGAYAAVKGSRALGMKTTKQVLLNGALRGARYGLRTSIPTAVGLAALTTVGSAVLKKRAENRAVKGKILNIVKAIKKKVT